MAGIHRRRRRVSVGRSAEGCGGSAAGGWGKAPPREGAGGGHPAREGLVRVAGLIWFRACGLMVSMMPGSVLTDHGAYSASRAALVCPGDHDAKRKAGIRLTALLVLFLLWYFFWSWWYCLIKAFSNFSMKEHVLPPPLWRAGGRAFVGVIAHPQLRARRAPVQ